MFKTDYIHYRNLHLCLSLGMKQVKIHVRLVNNEKGFLKSPADQLILFIKSLTKIMLLLMKLNPF